MKFLPLTVLVLFPCISFAAEAHVGSCARLDVPEAGVTAQPVFFLPKYHGCHPVDVDRVPRKGESFFKIVSPFGKGDLFSGEALYRNGEGGRVDVAYSLECLRDTEALGLCASWPLPAKRYAGGEIEIDGGRIVKLPTGKGMLRPVETAVSKVSVKDSSGRKTFEISFPSPQTVQIQDSRNWGGKSFVFRAFIARKGSFPAGEKTSFAYSLSVPGGLRCQTGPVKITAGGKWRTLKATPWICEGSALDFSKMRPTGDVAGKDGYLRAAGQNFEFEKAPGKRVRFFGVNICGDMNFALEAGEADRFAANLARCGYNSLRLHHHDSGIAAGAMRTELHPENMGRFDRLVKACIDNGIYLTTDIYVSRRLSYRQLGIDLPGAPQSYEEIKPLFYIHEGAYSNFIAFARNFLEHVNPHTGRRYADEPAMPLLSLVNEGVLGGFGAEGVKKHPDIWRPAWRGWLEKKARENPLFAKIDADAFPPDWSGKTALSQAFFIFAAELERRFIDRTVRFLREEIKAKALVTDMNISHPSPVAYEPVRARGLDYVDVHFYVDHPTFPEKAWSLPSARMNVNALTTQNVGPVSIAQFRHLDKPFCVSEWNHVAPANMRGQCGVLTGAFAGLQNWAGLWRFAWSHQKARHLNFGESPIGGFDLCTDPLNLASGRAVFALFLRGDMPELEKTAAIPLAEGECLAFDGKGMPFLNRIKGKHAFWFRKTGIAADGRLPDGVEKFAGAGDFASMADAEMHRRFVPENGKGRHVAVDREKGTLMVDTPRTCAGASAGRIEAGALSAQIAGGYATVCASSLDGLGLGRSSRILLTHLTDLQNSDSVFADPAQRILLERGTPPYLMRTGTADISLALKDGNWKVYILGSCGRRMGEIPCGYCDGKLRFMANVAHRRENATYLYEIVDEPLPRQLGILTPPPKKAPRINGARVIGVRPGSPVFHKIAVTGEEPLEISVKIPPTAPGLKFDPATRMVSGSVADAGVHVLEIKAANGFGEASGRLAVKAGGSIALTPPMGWNSWNCFGREVSAENVRAAADAFVGLGLDDHGWSYIVIDDFWARRPCETNDVRLMGAERSGDGTILPNGKFPDMKALAGYIHSKGLKAGIYSSPGALTCGKCTGSLGYENRDAQTFAEWGFDYLKYDWCYYRDFKKPESLAVAMKPYQVMGKALREQKRDIVFSLCQYGWMNVETWGGKAYGQLWRTTFDVFESWVSVTNSIRIQEDKWMFSSPGGWNDPDMLVVGKQRGGRDRRQRKLTPNEAYTHISMWSVIASPLMIGCDLADVDAFTLSLLTNDEVIEVNQDPLGAGGAPVAEGADWQIWAKPMEDGSISFALYNMADGENEIVFDLEACGMSGAWRVRDLWRQRDEGAFSGRYAFRVPARATHLVRMWPQDGASLRAGMDDIRENAWKRVRSVASDCVNCK